MSIDKIIENPSANTNINDNQLSEIKKLLDIASEESENEDLDEESDVSTEELFIDSEEEEDSEYDVNENIGKTAEISEDAKTKSEKESIVLSIKDGIVICNGLQGCTYGEMVTINDTDGMVLNLEEKTVGIVIFGNDDTVKVGDSVRRSKDLMSIKFSEDLIGHVVNALGTQ